MRARASALAAIGLAMACIACGAPERPLLEQFFSASSLRDRTALQKFSSVVFEPLQDGIVTTFDIVGVASEPGQGTATKNVTVKAPVRMPDGRTIDKTLIITLQRDAGEWKITGMVSRQTSPRI